MYIVSHESMLITEVLLGGWIMAITAEAQALVNPKWDYYIRLLTGHLKSFLCLRITSSLILQVYYTPVH